MSDGWQRRHFRPGGDRPFVFTVVYGLLDVPSIDAYRYRTRGLPNGVDARSFDRVTHERYLRDAFEEGYAWEQVVRDDPELARSVANSPGMVAFAGDIVDDTSLDYLRDVIGMLAALLDHGGLAVYDPLTFRWWRPADWKAAFFDSDEPHPQRHVMIYYSQESDGFWLHTRGLLTFGRPDLSVHGVPQQDFDVAAGMCNELVDFQAFGGLLCEGQVVRHPGLGRFIVHYAGDRDDPDFNNVHVELTRSVT